MYVKMGGASATIDASMYCKRVYLGSLRSEETRKGHATAIINLAVKLGQDLMLPVTLEVGAFYHQEKSQMQLVKFYKKFGFKVKSAAFGHYVDMHIPPILRLPYYPE